MSKISQIISAIILCAAPAMAQHTASVPSAVTSAFSKQYPAATAVKWEEEHGKYEVAFTNANNKMAVVYSAAGAVEETETAIALSALPKQALLYARTKGRVTEAARIVLANGTTVYEAEVNGKDLIFDEKGNFKEERAED